MSDERHDWLREIAAEDIEPSWRVEGAQESLAAIAELEAERDRIKRAGKALAEQVDDYFTGRPDGEDLLFAAAVLRETIQPNQEVDDE